MRVGRGVVLVGSGGLEGFAWFYMFLVTLLHRHIVPRVKDWL